MKYTAEIILTLNHKAFSSANSVLKLDWDDLRAYFLPYNLELFSDVTECQPRKTTRKITLKSIDGFEIYDAIKLSRKHHFDCAIIKEVSSSRAFVFTHPRKLYKLL
jgi:hypothetical protein